jgi:N6-adenosine-specific RNA methylase IME4
MASRASSPFSPIWSDHGQRSLAQRYDVVLADPPWSYYGQQDKWGAAAKFYQLMSDADLRHLPIKELLTPRSVVFVWATSPRLDLAMQCLGDWGLAFRGVAFVWDKTKRTGEPISAQGVRPSIVKPTTEFVLAGSPVAKGRPLPIADEGVPQVVMAPKRAHSAKPPVVQDRIERLYPTAQRIELFARTRRSGWDAWGLDLERPAPGADVEKNIDPQQRLSI